MIHCNSYFAVRSCNAVQTPCFSIPLQLIISASESFGRTTVSILHLLAAINEHVIWGIGSSHPPSSSAPPPPLPTPPPRCYVSASLYCGHILRVLFKHSYAHTHSLYLVASHSYFFFFFLLPARGPDVLCTDAALLHHAEQSISERQ